MPRIARVGDGSTHGGSIVTGAASSFVNGMAIARVGDMLNCPQHGMQAITSGSAGLMVEGKEAARAGDLCACGAVLTGGSPDVEVD